MSKKTYVKKVKKFTPKQIERAVERTIKFASAEYEAISARALAEFNKTLLVAKHIDNGNLKGARRVWQNNKDWMDIPAAAMNILYPRYYE